MTPWWRHRGGGASRTSLATKASSLTILMFYILNLAQRLPGKWATCLLSKKWSQTTRQKFSDTYDEWINTSCYRYMDGLQAGEILSTNLFQYIEGISHYICFLKWCSRFNQSLLTFHPSIITKPHTERRRRCYCCRNSRAFSCSFFWMIHISMYWFLSVCVFRLSDYCLDRRQFLSWVVGGFASSSGQHVSSTNIHTSVDRCIIMKRYEFVIRTWIYIHFFSLFWRDTKSAKWWQQSSFMLLQLLTRVCVLTLLYVSISLFLVTF